MPTATDEPGRIFREAWITGVRKHYPGDPSPATSPPGTTPPTGNAQRPPPSPGRSATSSPSAAAPPASSPASRRAASSPPAGSPRSTSTSPTPSPPTSLTGTCFPNGSSKPTPTSSSTSSNSPNPSHGRGAICRSLYSRLVLNAAGVHPVSRDEHLQEMGIQFCGFDSPEPAKACQPRISFQVDLPVGPLVIVRCEHPKKVIADRLVALVGFGEAARAPLDGHAICLSARCLAGSGDAAARPGGQEKARFLRRPGRAGLIRRLIAPGVIKQRPGDLPAMRRGWEVAVPLPSTEPVHDP
jgi:hypothetical protein